MNLWNYGQNRSRFSLLSTWLEALYEDFAWNWASEILHPHNQKLGIQFWIQNLIPMTLSHTRNVSTQDLIVASQCPFGISPFLDYFHQGRHSLIECFFMTARVLDLDLFKSFSDFKRLAQVMHTCFVSGLGSMNLLLQFWLTKENICLPFKLILWINIMSGHF